MAPNPIYFSGSAMGDGVCSYPLCFYTVSLEECKTNKVRVKNEDEI